MGHNDELMMEQNQLYLIKRLEKKLNNLKPGQSILCCVNCNINYNNTTYYYINRIIDSNILYNGNNKIHI